MTSRRWVACGWAALLAAGALHRAGRDLAALNLARIVAICALVALGRRAG